MANYKRILRNLLALGLSQQAVALMLAKKIAQELKDFDYNIAVAVSKGLKGLVGEFVAIELGLPIIPVEGINLEALDISLAEAYEFDAVLDASDKPFDIRKKKALYIFEPSTSSKYEIGFVLGDDCKASRCVDLLDCLPIEARIYIGPGDIEELYPRRKMRTYKGENGKVLIVGGSWQFFGAPILASLAAERTGVDIVVLAAPEPVALTANNWPNLITRKLPGKSLIPEHLNELEDLLKWADSIAIGMGIGRSEEAFRFVREFIERRTERVVIDADALRALKGSLDSLDGAVLTPHAGEASYLLGRSVSTISERIEAALKLSKICNCTVVLKGYVDVIAFDGQFKLNKTHPPAMTVAGTGDVLSGIIASLLARGLKHFDAASIGVLINGLAGCLAFQKSGEGMRASDLIDAIPIAIAKPFEVFTSCRFYKRIEEVREAIERAGRLPSR